MIVKSRKYPPLMIVLRNKEVCYRLLVIEKGAGNISAVDESLYIHIWKKKPLKVTTKIPLTKIPNQIELKNDLSGVYDPYISYHSESGLVHLNAKDKDGHKIQFIKDSRTDNKVRLISSSNAIPFCSLLFPSDYRNLEMLPPRPEPFNYNYYEISKHPQYPNVNGLKKENFVIIDNNMIKKGHALSIEFFIHKSGGYLPKEEFRKDYQHSIIEMMRIDNNLAKLSYVVVFRNIIEKKKSSDPIIVCSIFSQNLAWVVGMK